jgi:TRAP-type C4-dicarboxylate transport system permease small subunit
MNAVKMMAIGLILGGFLALMYGGFTYTKDTQEMKIGSLELSVQERQTVNIPVWAGIGAIVLGGVLLVTGGRKS